MEILEKLQSGERLNYEDGVKLWDLDLFDLGKFAFAIRKEKTAKRSISTQIVISILRIYAQIPVNFAHFRRTARTKTPIR